MPAPGPEQSDEMRLPPALDRHPLWPVKASLALTTGVHTPEDVLRR